MASNTPDPLVSYRRWAIVVFLAIDAFLVVADVIGPYTKDSYEVSPIVLGLAFGTTLTLLGLEGFARLFGGK